MNRVMHFEFPTEHPEKARKFYETVFGWKFKKWDGPMDYWLITTGPDDQPGINGGMSRRGPDGPGPANTIAVADVDKTLKNIAKAGGKITMPKMPLPGVGWFATFNDPEGNPFGVIQPDMSAK